MWNIKALLRGLRSTAPGCPFCLSSGVRPSLQSASRLARTLGLEPYVCRECHRHFVLPRRHGRALSADGEGSAVRDDAGGDAATGYAAADGMPAGDTMSDAYVEEPTPTIELPKPQPLSADALRSLDDYFAKHCQKPYGS